MTPLRITHVITGLSRGGAESMLFKIAQVLSREAGFAHSIVTLLSENSFDFAKIEVSVQTLGMSRGWATPRSILKLRRLVAGTKPDLILGWMYHGNFAATIAAPKGVPVCWNIRHSIQDLANEKAMTRWLVKSGAVLGRRTKRIIYCSQVAQVQHENLGYPKAKSAFIPNGFDLDRFQASANLKFQFRSDLGIGSDATLIGHVARFHPMKNHKGLIEAFASIAGKLPNAHLVLIGRDVTPQNPALAEAASGSLAGRVHMLGERLDLDKLLPALDVYVSPSTWGEGFPNVLGEAMACAVPCVTTDVGESAAIVGDCGLVVAPGDTESLRIALERILTLAPAARGALGGKARQRVLNEYSLPVVAEKYASLFKQVIGE